MEEQLLLDHAPYVIGNANDDEVLIQAGANRAVHLVLFRLYQMMLTT